MLPVTVKRYEVSERMVVRPAAGGDDRRTLALILGVIDTLDTQACEFGRTTVSAPVIDHQYRESELQGPLGYLTQRAFVVECRYCDQHPDAVSIFRA